MCSMLITLQAPKKVPRPGKRRAYVPYRVKYGVWSLVSLTVHRWKSHLIDFFVNLI